ncbi:MAG: aminopeptidase P family protein [Burkholderiales bacterium]|nr:aminopeptidase P family protein [Burkholderiales bacterium]
MGSSIHKQAVGSHFDAPKMLLARDKTFEAVHRIAQKVTVGMAELDARAMAMDVLREMGMDRTWHPALVRFGANTLKKFNQVSEGNPVLQPNDIFFVDLGVVWDGHEGDAGATFVVGDDADMRACADACKLIYDEVEAHWRKTRCSGKALYVFAEKVASTHGWRLNVEIRGHRVSDFPHAIYKAGDLGDLDEVPEVGLWVLEIQIAHLSKPYGAFYEDLLVG